MKNKTLGVLIFGTALASLFTGCVTNSSNPRGMYFDNSENFVIFRMELTPKRREIYFPHRTDHHSPANYRYLW